MAAIDEAGLVSQTLPVRDTLFFKIQGDPAAIESTARTVQQIVASHGSSNFVFAQTDEEAEELVATTTSTTKTSTLQQVAIRHLIPTHWRPFIRGCSRWQIVV